MSPHFTFIQGKAQMNNDLKKSNKNKLMAKDATREEKMKHYMDAALADPDCAGFSTLGYYKSSIDTLSASKHFGSNDGTYVKKRYQDGLYVCGCVKNCGKYLKRVLENVQLLGAFFERCEVVIAYDTSYDDSLHILNEMSKVMNITILHTDNTSKDKVINICSARNSLLGHIRTQNEACFKYILMMDMDNVSASPINMEVFHKYMGRSADWDALSFNQKDYYDIWALSIDDYLCSCWHFESKPYMGAKLENVDKIKTYITDKLDNCKKNGDELVECVSAFNGLALYKKEHFIACAYDTDIKKVLRYITADQIKRNEAAIGFRFNIDSWSGTYDCEHRHFHLMAKRGNPNVKIRISPECLFKEYIEDDVQQQRSKYCQFVSSRGIMESCDITPLNSHFKTLGPNADTQVVYMRAKELRQFVANAHSLAVSIVLVTGDCTETMPTDIFPTTQDFTRFVENEKIIHWFSQNCVLTSHPKLSQIPLGLDYHTIEANKVPAWGRQCSPLMQEMLLKSIQTNAATTFFWEREVKCYGNFHFLMTTRYGKEDRRAAIKDVPKDLVFYEPKKVNRMQCWKTQSKYAFVLSPLGNGYDCHRTWEALLLGCIVIMKKNPIDALFADLPVLLVDEWKDVTQELLENTANEYRAKKFNYEKLNLKYWMDSINNKK
jgi:hypothetical protein